MSLESLPFGRMNLRWNPFGEVPRRDWGALVVEPSTAVEVAGRLRQGAFALQILGPCGFGKSSLLWAMHSRFDRASVSYFAPKDDPSLGFVDGCFRFFASGERPVLADEPVYFLDESQRVPARLRRKLYKKRASYVLATHEDHRAELSEAGIEVVTWELPRRELSMGLLRSICSRRVEWARRAAGPVPVVHDSLLRQLREKHGRDLRAIGDALYDWFQRRRSMSIGEL